MVEIRNKSFFEMPVDDIEYILHNHPEYDDEWIYWAAPILSRYYSISLSDLTQLNSSQVKSLWDALLWFPNDEFIVDILLTRGLNSTQMKVISLAYKDGLSRDQIDFLARKEIPYMKLNYIIKAPPLQAGPLHSFFWQKRFPSRFCRASTLGISALFFELFSPLPSQKASQPLLSKPGETFNTLKRPSQRFSVNTPSKLFSRPEGQRRIFNAKCDLTAFQR